MNKEQLLTVFSDILKEKDVLKARGYDERNYRPHPFTVGAKHQLAAEKENKGVMTEEILQRIPCEHLYCDLSYEEHTSEKTLILQLTRDATEHEVNEELLKIKPSMKEHGVISLAFADTEEKFKFLKDGDNKNEGEPQS